MAILKSSKAAIRWEITVMRSAAALAMAMLSLAAFQHGAEAQEAAAAPASVDYKNDASWLCRPGRADACDTDMTTTSIAPNGALTKVAWTRAHDAPVDCFYVYPTASQDMTPNSDMNPSDPGEISTVRRQAALLGANCRVFAPIYRSITLAGLRSGKLTPQMINLAYGDVKAAWKDYLARDNDGRGVVIYGHSQGATLLKRLLMEDIDGKPVQDKVIMAIIVGEVVLEPEGKDVGGDLKSMPLCRKDGQTGCVITYSSFRAGKGPMAGAPFPFGQSNTEGMVPGCTNPARLEGGKAAVNPIFNAKGRLTPFAAPQAPWLTPEKPIDTDFVRTPGLVSAECVTDGRKSYLAISVNADPKDPRVDEISGDQVHDGKISPEWGMHAMDVPLALGDLQARVISASKTYMARKNAYLAKAKN